MDTANPKSGDTTDKDLHYKQLRWDIGESAALPPSKKPLLFSIGKPLQ